MFGACAAAELELVVVGVDQPLKRDFTTGWAAVCVAVMELVDVVPVVVLTRPGKTDGATVVLLVDPNTEDVLLEENVEAGLVVVRDADCPKPAPAVGPPKMGLKFWTEGLLSGVEVVDEVVGVTAKMGLNPEASRGLLLLTEPELLAGAAAETGVEADEAVGVLILLGSPNRTGPAAGGVLLGALDT